MQDRGFTDPQDPLPEASWAWRRVFTFTALALAFAVAIGLSYAVNRIVGNIVGRIDSMDAVSVARITVVALGVILDMFRMMFWTVITVTLFYMVAPSAEQITKMIQTARLLRGGVRIASRARHEAPDRTEETQATVGLPPQPAVPPSDPEPPEALPDAPWASMSPPAKPKR